MKIQRIPGSHAIIILLFFFCAAFQQNRLFSQDSVPGQEPGYLVVSAGIYSVLDTWASTGYINVRLQGCKWWIFSPQAGFLISYQGSYMIYAGITWPARPWKWLVIETGAALGYYEKGEGLDLAYPLEARLSLSVMYQFRNSMNLGVEIVHISNADLGMPNPGTESVAITVQLPLGMLFKQ